MRRRAASAVWFVLVGATAALVHWGVVVGLVEALGWAPLRANLAGWLCAFGVSFGGHHGLSFRGHGTAWPRAVLRMFIVSAGGFAVNEAAYALLLRDGGLPYQAGLALVLVGVAGGTWVLSRRWVFRRS